LNRRFRRSGSLFSGEFAFNDEFWSAVFWLTEKRTFADNYDVNLPQIVLRAADETRRTAIELHIMLGCRYTPGLDREIDKIERLRESATTEPDGYLRYWYSSIAERAEERIEKQSSAFGVGGFADLFGRAASFESDDDDEDELDPDEYDPHCDCQHCTEVRNRLGVPHPWDEDDEQEEPDVRVESFDDSPSVRFDVPTNSDPNIEPPPQSTARRPAPPPDVELRRKRPRNPMAKRGKNKRKGSSR
jgi:hypothetical protein